MSKVDGDFEKKIKIAGLVVAGATCLGALTNTAITVRNRDQALRNSEYQALLRLKESEQAKNSPTETGSRRSSPEDIVPDRLKTKISDELGAYEKRRTAEVSYDVKGVFECREGPNTYRLDFGGDGRFSQELNNKIVRSGNYSIKGKTIAFPGFHWGVVEDQNNLRYEFRHYRRVASK